MVSSFKSVLVLSFQILIDIWNHPANANRKTRSMCDAIAWQFHKRFLDSDKLVSFHGMLLQCPPSNHSASRAIYFPQYPDYWEMKFVEKFLKKGDRFIDIGANVGLYSLLALTRVGTEGYVHSVEPNSALSTSLQVTKRMNKSMNWSIHQIAVGEVNDRGTLTNTGDDCTSHITINFENAGENNVNIVAIHNYFSDGPYTMIKLDIEGYEPFAIRGMREWLIHKNAPVLLIEIAGYSDRYGISSQEFIAELEELNYFIAIYCPKTNALIRNNEPWKIPVDNVLAIPIQSKPYVLERLSYVRDSIEQLN